ncbi:MAG: HPF/RaiA family ribosome-associated protein [Gemmatimonadota bacterium]|nr:HPF/RaiA family ribosome-associated protein [Gemmatimonadota bacterium]MDH4347232.1 HPF/RaiA family ribosome-associated protein [Gemmatimonadota bacterium]MDH5256260.1 HPF/RaiA family ribosome-associated protein [Gammaproteobacteria bacterium]
MAFTIDITSRDVPLPAIEEDLIRRAVESLARYGPRILHCQAVVDVPHRRPGGEPVAWVVRLSLAVPGKDILINRQPKPTLREALDDARQAAQRRLRDRARSRRQVGAERSS